MVVDELGDLKDPSHSIRAIKARDIEFDVVAGRGRRLWMR